MSNVFFTSDMHFYHENIIKYSSRPFESVEDMNEKLISNWNSVVSKNDIVYDLGDFAFSNIKNIKGILKRLNGKHFFIYGNHDHVICKNKKTLLEEKLFFSIENYKSIKINDKNIVLFHYGCRVWDKSFYGSWHLYGHSHGTLPPLGKSVDVGIDSKFIHDEYRPTSFDEIKKFMDNVE